MKVYVSILRYLDEEIHGLEVFASKQTAIDQIGDWAEEHDMKYYNDRLMEWRSSRNDVGSIYRAYVTEKFIVDIEQRLGEPKND